MNEYINKRINEDLYKRIRLGAVFYVIGILVSALSDDLYEHALPQIISATVFFIVLTVLRFYLPKPPEHIDATRHWRRNIAFVSMLSSVAWGAAVAWVAMHPAYDTAMQTMLLCTIAFATATAYQFCLVRTVAQINCVLFTLPFVLTIIIYQPEKYPLAIAISVYCVYLVLSAIQLQRQYLSSLNTEMGLFEAKNELKSLSLTDELTGLANRRHFRVHFSEAYSNLKSSGDNFAILLVDLDLFKRINDEYGHLVGDQCIQFVANVLQAVFTRDCDLVSRIGGEEFAVVFRCDGLHEAVVLAEKIQKRLGEDSIESAESKIKVTASIGIALTDRTLEESEHELFKRADDLLFEAKSAGRNCIKY
ncbi:GGDEF domain-containing protein [Alteromonas sediminis]|uniref:diguanylate cyclase n=1 Tax=Alteromonas sediminis TaxID=2259342 RepID=A0A3N5Y077_9ALTE|nr:GGDEF domain-containing protein [Alteromonas sediminis]RPJ67017.1 GGDEF domain-containing protein [Alteromonas sediminis]